MKEQERSPKQSTVNVVLAVVITALVVWVSKDGRAPDCGYQPDPDSRPAECTISYGIWVDQAFPNQAYFQRFELDGSDQSFFDACTSFAFATLGTPGMWALDMEKGGWATVPDRVVDACRQYVIDVGIPVIPIGP